MLNVLVGAPTMVCSNPAMCADDDVLIIDENELISSVLHAESLLIGPLAANNDGYKWPSLYAEIDEMLDTCIVIQPLSQLRMEALKKMSMEKAAPILRLPTTRAQVLSMISRNSALLSKTNYSTYEMLETTRDRNMLDKSVRKTISSQRALSTSTLVVFEDGFDSNQVVYSIDVNSKRERISICFRGTTDMKWTSSFDAFMRGMDNPLHGHRYGTTAQCKHVRVHHCFHDKLFQPMVDDSDPRIITAPSIYEEILMKQLVPIIANHPGYKVYVTGHSYGAGLATLFAFKAACEPDSKVPKPVSVFTFGGPYVGDASFRSAHQLLESLGKLRNLRVTNQMDMVTTNPKMSARSASMYKHVGLNLRMMSTGPLPMELSYPRVQDGYLRGTMEELARAWDQSMIKNITWNQGQWDRPFHSLREYNERVEILRSFLKTLNLNELYCKENIVGYLVPQF